MSQPNQKISQSQNSNRSTVAEYPEHRPPHFIQFIFKKYQYRRPGTNQILQPNRNSVDTISTDSIILPLPSRGLNDVTGVMLNVYQQGFLGDAASAAAANASSAMASQSGFAGAQNAVEAIRGGIEGAINTEAIIKTLSLRGSDNLQSNIDFLVRRGLDQVGSFGRNYDLAVGNTANPKTAIIFEGVNIKQWDFGWSLAPHSREESDRVRNIVNMFKRHALPTYDTIDGLSKALLRYPSTVDVYLHGVDSDYYIKFKTCMIDTVSVNYAPNGIAIRQGGKPAEVTIDVQMRETDIHTSEDYGGGSGFDGPGHGGGR